MRKTHAAKRRVSVEVAVLEKEIGQKSRVILASSLGRSLNTKFQSSSRWLAAMKLAIGVCGTSRSRDSEAHPSAWMGDPLSSVKISGQRTRGSRGESLSRSASYHHASAPIVELAAERT